MCTLTHRMLVRVALVQSLSVMSTRLKHASIKVDFCKHILINTICETDNIFISFCRTKIFLSSLPASPPAVGEERSVEVYIYKAVNIYFSTTFMSPFVNTASVNSPPEPTIPTPITSVHVNNIKGYDIDLELQRTCCWR